MNFRKLIEQKQDELVTSLSRCIQIPSVQKKRMTAAIPTERTSMIPWSTCFIWQRPWALKPIIWTTAWAGASTEPAKK